jgi:RNA polymerase sigma-70 factor (ECF subfamily)
MVRASVSSRELVAGLIAGEDWAERKLLECYTQHVERILARITGQLDLDDRVQEVFVRVLDRASSLRDPDGLPGFVTQVAVFVAREALRARRRKRWLVLVAPDELPDRPDTSPSDEARWAMKAFYEIVDGFDADERIPFVLRHVEGMELTEVAEACGVSLSTVKRRLAAAESRFRERATDAPDLAPWVARSSKWARAN